MRLSLSGRKKAFCVFSVIILLAACLCLVGFPNSPRGLNVVLITIDALRADHLGCYGYKRDTSPNIDALAREGALFTQAVAQSSHTPTSMGVLATSTYPPTNRLSRWGDSLNPDIPTLGEILKARGYKTVFVGGNGSFRDGLHGFDRGFDEFYNKNMPAPILTQKASELVGENGSVPFFLWIHYMDAHDYAPSKEFEGLYVGDKFYDKQKKLPIVKSVAGRYDYRGIADFMAKKNGGIDNPDYYIALYDGAIRFIDQQIGFLLRNLALLSGKRKTLVIITADHGEMLGERGCYFHHSDFLYEPLIKIPLLLWWPGKVPAKRVDAPVSASLDVFPTILGALKIKKHRDVQGVDLTSLSARGGRRSSPEVYSDEGYNRVGVRTNDWKLIHHRWPEAYELFDLKNDPGEMNNLVSTEKALFDSLKKKLDDYDRKFPNAKMSLPVLSKEAREGLKSLGYLQ